MTALSEYAELLKYTFIEKAECIKIDIKWVHLEFKHQMEKIKRVKENLQYEYWKWKILRREKKQGNYEKAKETMKLSDEVRENGDQLLDEMHNLKKEFLKFDKMKIKAEMCLKRRFPASSKYVDNFYIDEKGKKRLIEGEEYHNLFYRTYDNGEPINNSARRITCLKVENEKYLLKKENEEPFWISFDDLGWKIKLYDVGNSN